MVKQEQFQHQYDNGLVLVAQHMPWLQSAAFSINLPAGCRYDPADKIGPQLSAKMLEQSKVIARAMPQGDILGFAPPFCLTNAEADEVVAATVNAVGAVFG